MGWLTLPAQLTSPLDAVNVLIGSLGESPVAALDPSPSVDVDNALNVLNEADLEIQDEGWHWNREYAFPLTLNVDKTVSLPAQTLRVVSAYYAPGTLPIGPVDITPRGGKLYDLVNHTSTFKFAPVVDLIFRLNWDDLPQAARSLITLTACQKFQSRSQQSTVVLQVNGADVTRARKVLEQHEDETGKANAVSGNLAVQLALQGNGGMRRNRGH